jgi:alpha-beta hydrolase superfamily lysophospholipase
MPNRFAQANLRPRARPRLSPSVVGTDLDAYLEAAEAKFADIRPGARKQIVWADPQTKSKTPIAIIYVHGFSASPAELRPLPDRVATSLGANLMFTRLAGHGRSPDAMAEADIGDWLNDLEEALAVGERLGDRIVVMATSTGASLVTYALTLDRFRERISAVVFFSPNYRISDPLGFALTWPFARGLARLAIGKRRSFDPINAAHAAGWTTSYPVEALLPMARIAANARRSAVERILIPALFVRSPKDQVVDPAATDRVAARWGGPHAVLDPGPVGDPSSHVIAGDALSPETTGPLAAAITAWLKDQPILR